MPFLARYVLVHEPKARLGEPSYEAVAERTQERFRVQYEAIIEVRQSKTTTLALRVYRKRPAPLPHK